jgi:hypothetical protein
MTKKLNLTSVLIYRTGTMNVFNELYGQPRKDALAQYRDSGTLPSGYSAWNDRSARPISSPEEIDWAGMLSN